MVDDAIDQMAHSLQNIEALLRQQQDQSQQDQSQQDQSQQGSGQKKVVKNNVTIDKGGGNNNNRERRSAATVPLLNPQNYVVKESEDIEGIDEGEAVTLAPGQEKTIAQYLNKDSSIGIGLLAVGATDASNVWFRLKVDNKRTVGGVTNSPLGLLNDPFSFPNKIGYAIPAETAVQYQALRPEDANGAVEVAGRLHCEKFQL